MDNDDIQVVVNQSSIANTKNDSHKLTFLYLNKFKLQIRAHDVDK